MTFSPTHIRRPQPHRRDKGKVEAQLLAERDGDALYRVRFRDGRVTVVRNTVTTAGAFHAAFEALS